MKFTFFHFSKLDERVHDNGDILFIAFKIFQRFSKDETSRKSRCFKLLKIRGLVSRRLRSRRRGSIVSAAVVVERVGENADEFFKHYVTV